MYVSGSFCLLIVIAGKTLPSLLCVPYDNDATCLCLKYFDEHQLDAGNNRKLRFIIIIIITCTFLANRKVRR